MTDFQANTQTIIQAKQSPDQHLFAIAMVYQTPTPTSASTPGPSASASSGDAPPSLPSETGSSQPTSSSDASNGLSAGASGGIGVGAGVGVLLLAFLAFLLWRRRRSVKTRGKSELPTAASSPPPAGAATAGTTQNGASGYGERPVNSTYGTGDAAYWDARAKHEALQSTPSPVPTGNTIAPGRHEMYSGDTRSELPGYRD
ncbi:hypothetical protein PG988_015477 [Apiospora saccharicola]